MKIYSVHTINDGRWQIVVHILEDSSFEHQSATRDDLRQLVDANYTLAAEEMARLLLEAVVNCEQVEINLLSGPSLRIQKQ